MNIAQIAQEVGVSKQAVYQKLKRNGIRIDAIKDPISGEISASNAAIIIKMFTGNDDESIESEALEVEAVKELEACKQELERVNSEKNKLQEQLNEVINEREFLRNALTSAQNALQQAQQLQAMTLQRMMPEPRETFAGRLFGIFSRKNRGTEG